MSSEGCSARQSMYSPNMVAVDEVLGDLHRLSRLGAEVGVGAVADGLLVLLGDAEQHADHPHGHLRAQVGDEVEPARADERVEAACAELPDLRLELGDPPRREDPGQQPPVDRVDRRVLEDERRPAASRCSARMSSMMPPRPEMNVFAVEQALLDVVKPGQRVEVVRLVVVQRRLVPHPAVDRVRVGIDLDAVRVVVDVSHAAGHLRPPCFRI